MNALAKLLGEDDSGSVVPVLANVPRAAYAARNRAAREKQAPVQDCVSRMVSESGEDGSNKKDDSIFPEDAEDIDQSDMTVGKPLKPVRDVVQEPSHPTGDKEKYLTPYSALTAPDVTPDSMQPIDPSRVPGVSGPEKFTARDLERAGPEHHDNDMVNTAMNVLLGRGARASKPASKPEEFAQAGDVMTEEQAAAMLNIATPLQENAKARAQSVLVPSLDGGSAMPPPSLVSDGSAVYAAMRRYVK